MAEGKSKSFAKLTNLISVDLAARCSGGEKVLFQKPFPMEKRSSLQKIALKSQTMSEMQREKVFKELLKQAGVLRLLAKGVRVTVGISTETIAAAQTIGNIQSISNSNSRFSSTNTNNFSPQPTGYSGYSDDW